MTPISMLLKVLFAQRFDSFKDWQERSRVALTDHPDYNDTEYPPKGSGRMWDAEYRGPHFTPVCFDSEGDICKTEHQFWLAKYPVYYIWPTQVPEAILLLLRARSDAAENIAVPEAFGQIDADSMAVGGLKIESSKITFDTVSRDEIQATRTPPQQVPKKNPPPGYPFLEIAKKHGVDYGEVLRVADGIKNSGGGFIEMAHPEIVDDVVAAHNLQQRVRDGKIDWQTGRSIDKVDARSIVT